MSFKRMGIPTQSLLFDIMRMRIIFKNGFKLGQATAANERLQTDARSYALLRSNNNAKVLRLWRS